MGHPLRRRVVLARALVALLVVLTATACGGDGPPAVAPKVSNAPSVPVDPPVEAIGLPDNVELVVADSGPGAESGDNLSFVSPVHTLTPTGPLGSSVTVRLRLDNALPTTIPVLVASRTSPDQPWGYLPGALTSDQRHVDFNTTSFNEVGVLSVDLDGAVSSFQEDLRAGLATGINRTVKKPTCAGEDEARKSGYTVAASKTKTLFWCFGMEGGKRVVKVTNRRPIPVEVAHPKVDVLTNAPAAAAWAPWSGVLGTGNTFLAPGRTATYDADLEPKTELLLNAESRAVGQSLRVLQAGARALVLRLNRFGAGTANVVETVKAFLAMPQCAKSLSKGSDAVITGCFSKPKLVRTFGSRALLVAPLVSAPSTPAFLRQHARAITLRARTTERQRILVRRAAPDFTALSGVWSGKNRLLAINAEGLVKESVNDDTGARIIDLTYQLADPETVGPRSTAGATIVAVKVSRRKLLKGRVPRVGDTTTIRLRDGIVAAPYLKTRYCNAAAAKRGNCGL
jgi:hypothetical protein